MVGILAGKKFLVMGVANKRSIAWGCAEQIKALGGEVVYSYQMTAWKRACSSWAWQKKR